MSGHGTLWFPRQRGKRLSCPKVPLLILSDSKGEELTVVEHIVSIIVGNGPFLVVIYLYGFHLVAIGNQKVILIQYAKPQQSRQQNTDLMKPKHFQWSCLVYRTKKTHPLRHLLMLSKGGPCLYWGAAQTERTDETKWRNAGIHLFSKHRCLYPSCLFILLYPLCFSSTYWELL